MKWENSGNLNDNSLANIAVLFHFLLQVWCGQNAKSCGWKAPGNISCSYGMFWISGCCPFLLLLSQPGSWHSFRPQKHNSMWTTTLRRTTSPRSHFLQKLNILLMVSLVFLPNRSEHRQAWRMHVEASLYPRAKFDPLDFKHLEVIFYSWLIAQQMKCWCDSFFFLVQLFDSYSCS